LEVHCRGASPLADHQCLLRQDELDAVENESKATQEFRVGNRGEHGLRRDREGEYEGSASVCRDQSEVEHSRVKQASANHVA
jgi:hypothetical protein